MGWRELWTGTLAPERLGLTGMSSSAGEGRTSAHTVYRYAACVCSVVRSACWRLGAVCTYAQGYPCLRLCTCAHGTRLPAACHA